MSGVLPLDLGGYAPIPYSPLYQAGEIDKAGLLDCTDNMKARLVTIVSVGMPLIVRKDGATYTSADLTITNATVQGGGYLVTWTFNTNGNSAIYYVGFPLNLSDSSKITRWIVIATLPEVG